MRRDIAPLLVQALEGKGYVVVDKDGQHPTGEPVPLGTGGSSIVYQAMYRNRLRRAVKIVIPRDDLSGRIDPELFARNFDTEVAILGALSHQNVAKISDFGNLKHDGREYPFIATDFVDGNQNGFWDLSASAEMRLEHIDSTAAGFTDPGAC